MPSSFDLSGRKIWIQVSTNTQNAAPFLRLRNMHFYRNNSPLHFTLCKLHHMLSHLSSIITMGVKQNSQPIASFLWMRRKLDIIDVTSQLHILTSMQSSNFYSNTHVMVPPASTNNFPGGTWQNENTVPRMTATQGSIMTSLVPRKSTVNTDIQSRKWLFTEDNANHSFIIKRKKKMLILWRESSCQ